MQLRVVEENKGMLKIEVAGESATLTQLIAEQVWNNGGEAAALQEHPFMEEPKILVTGTNPRKLLEKAASSVQDTADKCKEEWNKALKSK
jgi:DNA-directed RNA polymerase subunit L